jgi:site-specific recombinase XerD
MSELAERIDGYVRELELRGVSGHTVRAYAADLAKFLEYL